MPRPKGKRNLTPKERAEILRVHEARKLPVGRPMDWRPKFNKAVIAWFMGAYRRPFKEHSDDKGRVQLIPKRCPTFGGFAHSIGACVDTLNEWGKAENKAAYPGFSESYAQAKQLQADILIAQGQSGAGNSGFAIFMLKNNHGMRDTTDHTNDGGKFEPPVIVNPGGDMTI